MNKEVLRSALIIALRDAEKRLEYRFPCGGWDEDFVALNNEIAGYKKALQDLDA